MERQPNTEYILSLSYGKDSIACLEAIKQLGYPLDRIIHAEIWATDIISADLPPMVEFKTYADRIIKERYGFDVEHICAVRGVTNTPTQDNPDGGSMVEKVTYEKLFYHIPKRRKATREREREREKSKDSQANSICIATPDSNKRHSDNSILGFPIVRGNWCNSNLKLNCLRISSFNRERKLVYTTQTEGFLIAPLNKAQRKILFSTLE